MTQNTDESWMSRQLDRLNKVANLLKSRLGIYLGLITAFWGGLVAFPKIVDSLLPDYPDGQKWIRNWLAIGIGLGLPTLILLLFEGLPALLKWWSHRQLIRWGIQGEAARGYFGLTPYGRADSKDFRRADQAHVAVSAWLRDVGPTILYLTGRSGSGKSSLLNAAVLPNLETGDPSFLTLTLRGYGDPVADLVAALHRPGLVYKLPPKDLPSEVEPLLRRVDERLKEQNKRLLVLIDQFEEFVIFYDHEPKTERLLPLLELLLALCREPLKCVRLLLVLRSEYLGDVVRFALPRPHLGTNWMEVGPFTEAEARDFLSQGFKEPGLGSDLIATVVRHASELDEVRGKVRPVVLNMLGLALGSRAGQAGRVLNAREAQRLMFEYVDEGLSDNLIRDHAPDVLSRMITPEGLKQKPASAVDLAREAGLTVPLIQGYLIRLGQLGFVRSFDLDREHSTATQVWEVSHDFVARLLSLVLPTRKTPLLKRARQFAGPVLMTLGIATLFGLAQYQAWRHQAKFSRVNQLQEWAGRYKATTQRLEDGTFEVRFSNPTYSSDAMNFDFSGFASLISGLDLSNGSLTNLPPKIGSLTNLKTLDLHKNSLKNLPREIGSLTNLESLNLCDNGLTNLPPEIGSLTKLKSLNLRNSGLRNLPPEIGSLTKLKGLDLSESGLENLPPEIGSLTNLDTLFLSANGLKNLPPEIGSLTNLDTLDLRSNGLRNLPPEIGGLTKLKGLDLSSNGLKNLPPEITRLTNLKTLDLSSNGLQNLPPEIGRLTNLESLFLSGNDLTNLPREIGSLTNLKSLDLSGNGLTTLPPEIGSLTKLSSLKLRSNGLKNLPPEIGSLTKLVWLNLRNNGLTNLPPEIGSLTHLISLDLSLNGLTTLPREIGRLTHLMSLDLSGNPMTTLPPEIGSLTNLTELDFSRNSQLIDPPPQIVNQGTEAILGYLRKKLESAPGRGGTVPGRERPAPIP